MVITRWTYLSSYCINTLMNYLKIFVWHLSQLRVRAVSSFLILLLFYTRICVSGNDFQAMEINGYQACRMDETFVGEWLLNSP